MENLQREEIRKWIDIWKKAGTALEKVKVKELRDSNYYKKNQVLLNEMLKYAFEHRTVRTSSGLVKQQQIFMKYHQK